MRVAGNQFNCTTSEIDFEVTAGLSGDQCTLIPNTVLLESEVLWSLAWFLFSVLCECFRNFFFLIIIIVNLVIIDVKRIA